MSARLAAHVWVGAYLRRVQMEGVAVYVARRGDATAGAVLIKLALLDGTATAYTRMPDLTCGGLHWQVLCDGPEPEVDAAIMRQREFDPDLWVIEVEDARGRHFLDDMP